MQIVNYVVVCEECGELLGTDDKVLAMEIADKHSFETDHYTDIFVESSFETLGE
jgi:non-homologous end joining protein Ku